MKICRQFADIFRRKFCRKNRKKIKFLRFFIRAKVSDLAFSIHYLPKSFCDYQYIIAPVSDFLRRYWPDLWRILETLKLFVFHWYRCLVDFACTDPFYISQVMATLQMLFRCFSMLDIWSFFNFRRADSKNWPWKTGKCLKNFCCRWFAVGRQVLFRSVFRFQCQQLSFLKPKCKACSAFVFIWTYCGFHDRWQKRFLNTAPMFFFAKAT